MQQPLAPGDRTLRQPGRHDAAPDHGCLGPRPEPKHRQLSTARARLDSPTLGTAAGPDALIFTTETGQPLTRTRRTRVLRDAPESIRRPDVSWHHLRHTGATLAAISGATLAELQRRIRHSTARAAMRYQHVTASRDHDLADRLDALLAVGGHDVVDSGRGQ